MILELKFAGEQYFDDKWGEDLNEESSLAKDGLVACVFCLCIVYCCFLLIMIVIEARFLGQQKKKHNNSMRGQQPTLLGVSAQTGEVESRVGDLQPMDDMDDMDDEDFDEDLYSCK